MASPYLKIKTWLISEGLSIAALAREFTEQGLECKREELSMAIRGVREYPRLQDALAERMGTTRTRLFGPSRGRTKRRTAA